MTIAELVLASLVIGQSVAWISVDFRRFCKNFDRWSDRPAVAANNFEDFS